MQIELTTNFKKKVRKLPNSVAIAVAQSIRATQQAASFSEIPNFKALKGYRNYYRIRVGDYRMGLFWNGEKFLLETIGTRGDFYKTYPPK